MQRWEYCIVICNYGFQGDYYGISNLLAQGTHIIKREKIERVGNNQEVLKVLNELGKDGWEVVGVIQSGATEWTLKRTIEE